MSTLLCLQQITHEDLLRDTGNSAHCYVSGPGWEGSLGENGYMYVHG